MKLVFPDFKGNARFSSDRKYRYYLSRAWDDNTPECIFIMLNPSTATATENDPSVRRCMSFAHREGYGRLVVLNIFALRSTDPNHLYFDKDPIGPENDHYLKIVTKNKPLVVAAWGSHGALIHRGEEVCQLLNGTDLKCLGTTKEGHPKHPLYLPNNTPLIPYPRSEQHG